MDIFNIIGPVMIGPSSSHTAGAVRIGNYARKALDDTPIEAKIYLHGSFAATGVGHGTDKGIIAGILGMAPDDCNIPESFKIAKEKGLKFSFKNINIKNAHPNSVIIELFSLKKYIKLFASSIGGGEIKINNIYEKEV